MKPAITAEYPWLAESWNVLQAYLSSGRLPSALLISGPSGVGKYMLALAFAQRLLCRAARGETACNACDSCVLAAAGTHPDLLIVTPEEEGKPIKVEAIREMIHRLSLTPQYGGRRIVLLQSAHAMNRHAANGILKSLEEPDAATSFLLITSAPELLPVTVRSRCQKVSVKPPPRTTMIEWLRARGGGKEADALWALAQGAPLRALELINTDVVERWQKTFESWLAIAAGRSDPVMIANTWEGSAGDTVRWISVWVDDLVRMKSVGPQMGNFRSDRSEGLSPLAAQLDLVGLFEYRDALARATRLLNTQTNRQLLMEELAVLWYRLAAQA